MEGKTKRKEEKKTQVPEYITHKKYSAYGRHVYIVYH